MSTSKLDKLASEQLDALRYMYHNNMIRGHDLAAEVAKIGSHLFKAPTPPPPPSFGFSNTDPSELMRMLHMRMRTPEGQTLPFDFITAYKNNENVVVFFVHKGAPGFLEDGWDLYPSDTLITKLRVLG